MKRLWILDASEIWPLNCYTEEQGTASFASRLHKAVVLKQLALPNFEGRLFLEFLGKNHGVRKPKIKDLRKKKHAHFTGNN